MHRPVTEYLRCARVSKSVTAVVLAAFVSLIFQPLALAAQLPGRPAAKATATAPDPSAQLAQTLEATEAKLGELIEDFTAGRDANPRLQDVKALHQQLKTLDQAALQSFTEVETHIKTKALPQVILDRHTDTVKSYTQDFQTLTNALTALEATPDNPGRKQHAEVAFNHLKEKQKKRGHTPVDPNNLPFRTPDGKVRPPHETPQAFRASLFKPEPVQLAASELTAGMLSTDMLSVAAVAAAPTPADLAPTEDVQITPEIQALAASLNNNPVKIYNWVRNNIKFLPTYGSIQGSQMTLETKQGNAFDTASLLIALLRASGIHARYTYGTVQIPVEKVMNWVGGVTVPEAAQQLLGQGGIPNIGLTQGGKIAHIKMEHVWVEAWVDFEPSRGAVHKLGDTWVPMDGSFKQYQFTQGMDIKTNVPFDATAFVNQVKASAMINETEGWVTGVDQNYIQTTLINYQNQVQTYINNTKPNATLGDVLGAQAILLDKRTVLAASLPYQKVATGNRFAVIPDNLRHRFQLNLYASALDRSLDSPFLTLNQTLLYLAGKKITLAFNPASQADTDLIASYLPTPHADGSPIQQSELPSSLPGYLIRLTAEIRVDGIAIGSGGNFTMGQELISRMGIFDPSRGWSFSEDNMPIAGDYQAVGLNLAGIPSTRAQSLQSTLIATKSKLDAGQVGGLNPENTTGDLLYGVLLGYFSAVDRHADLHSRSARMVQYRLPSFGTFTAIAETTYSFGIPRTVKFPGVVMDIDRLQSVVWHKDNNPAAFSNYNREIGLVNSVYEHLVPEKLLSDAQNPAESVSAVKALTIAAMQGQRIYTITNANLSSVLPQLSIGPEIRSEIESAVSAGKEVTVSQTNVTVSGWTGVGYLIVDPETGSGAYKISGGLNGSATSLCNSILLAIQIFIITALLILLITLLLGGLPAVVAAATVAMEILSSAASYISAAVLGLPAAIRAIVAASLIAFASSQVAAAGGVGEICEVQNPFPVGPINGRECLYYCPFSDTTIERPSRIGPVCSNQERYCPRTVAK